MKSCCCLRCSLTLIIWFSLPQPVEIQSTRTEPSELTRSEHPYDQFTSEQKKRQLEWKSKREAKRAKVQSTTPPISSSDNHHQAEDPVPLLLQQLAAKTEECCHLMKRLDNIEEANARILRNQMQMHEDFVKVKFL